MAYEMENTFEDGVTSDYAQAVTTARIATYDDFRSAPRVTEISPCRTNEYIENLASTIYTQAQQAGGTIPYTVIREVSENFIHAQFKEIVVSIFDRGNTIRFADQGPGIEEKDKAQLPGFSSATSPMKRYIRGVGSGLPLVKEYLSFSHGRISIEDNMHSGAVVTVSVAPDHEPTHSASSYPTHRNPQATPPIPAIRLDDREASIALLIHENGAMRLTDIYKTLDMPQSSTYRVLSKMKEAGIVDKDGKMFTLTDEGERSLESIS